MTYTDEERRLRKNASARRRNAARRPPTGPCGAVTYRGDPCQLPAYDGQPMCPMHSGQRSPTTCPCGACRFRRAAPERPAAMPADGQITIRWLLQMAREFDEEGERFPAVDFVVWLLPDVKGTREHRNVTLTRIEIALENTAAANIKREDAA